VKNHERNLWMYRGVIALIFGAFVIFSGCTKRSEPVRAKVQKVFNYEKEGFGSMRHWTYVAVAEDGEMVNGFSRYPLVVDTEICVVFADYWDSHDRWEIVPCSEMDLK